MDNYNMYSTIGSDEVGTGDFFGPVVVCAAYIPKENKEELMRLGLKDSKSYNDDKITEIAKILITKIKYSVYVLGNTKYNQVIKKHNMNAIKALLHNQAILNLIGKLGYEPELVLIDEFASRSNYLKYLKDEDTVYKNFKSTTKAESKSLAVAAASIIARYTFVTAFDVLSDKIGYNLLKGASSRVDELGARIIDEKGENFLIDCAKMNFKTLEKAKKINNGGF